MSLEPKAKTTRESGDIVATQEVHTHVESNMLECHPINPW